MKLQTILKKHKAINEYLRLTGGRLSTTFTHQYLPLFYSSNSLDIVLQNIIMALLGNLLQHIGSLSLLKTISIALPAVKVVIALPGDNTLIGVRKLTLRVKNVLKAAPSQADTYLLKFNKGARKQTPLGRYRFTILLHRLWYRSGQHPPAASA